MDNSNGRFAGVDSLLTPDNCAFLFIDHQYEVATTEVMTADGKPKSSTRMKSVSPGS